MAYVKKIWKDYPDTTTPILAADMNNIENGIEALDTDKVNTSDIVDNLTSTSTTVPLSAAQGKVLKDKFGNVTLYSSSGITSASATSENGYGIIFVFCELYVCLLQLQNTSIVIVDIFGTHADLTATINNKVVTISGLHNWDHYLFVGTNVINTITS